MKIRMFNGRPVIVADATVVQPTVQTDGDEGEQTFRAIGYRQSTKSAAAGGKANANGFRFRNEALPAIAASAAGRPFITGHDWGDVRARGGTITGAEQVEVDGDLALAYDVEAFSAWAIEGLANGTIDRFSVGIIGTGEISCTVHGTPVFESCWCFPGETVTVEVVDGKDRKLVDVIAEWEYEGGDQVELSAVNVPAVEGTGIVENAGDRRELLAELSMLCGRKHRELLAAAAPPAQPPAAPAAPSVLTADLAIALGLTADATAEQVQRRATELRTGIDAAHVEAEITRLIATHRVSQDVLVRLRSTAKLDGRAAFDSQLDLVRMTASTDVAPLARGALQSDARASSSPGGGPGEFDADGAPDALELNRHNPNLGALMKACQVTAADVRKHGSRTFNVLPDLKAIADATDARGDRFGTPQKDRP